MSMYDIQNCVKGSPSEGTGGMKDTAGTDQTRQQDFINTDFIVFLSWKCITNHINVEKSSKP